MSLSPLSDYYSLKAVLERFSDSFAILRNEMLGEFRWPIANLPHDLKVGETVVLKIANMKSEEDEKFVRMRKLLAELIN